MLLLSNKLCLISMHVSYNHRPLFLTSTFIALNLEQQNFCWHRTSHIISICRHVISKTADKLRATNFSVLWCYMCSTIKNFGGQSDLPFFVGARKFHLPDILCIYDKNLMLSPFGSYSIRQFSLIICNYTFFSFFQKKTTESKVRQSNLQHHTYCSSRTCRAGLWKS